MPVPERSRYQTISAVLTKDQVRRLVALRELRSTDLRPAGFSEVLREVVEVGMAAVLRAAESIQGSSPSEIDPSAERAA